MSPLPTDRADARRSGAARLRAVRAGVIRAWAGARGRVPSQVVYLHSRGVVCWPSRGQAVGTAFDSFAAWCAAHPGVDAHLCASGQVLHNLVVDADLQLDDEEAVRNYARQQFTHYYGPPAAAWPLAVWSDGPQRGACGLHGVDLAALRADADSHDIRLRGLTPAWSAGLATLSARHPEFAGEGRHALLLLEGALATWIVVEGGAVVALRQRRLEAPRVDAAVRLLGELAGEGAPLAGLPVAAGWGLDAPASLPPDAAISFGPLGDAVAMAEWLGAERRA